MENASYCVVQSITRTLYECDDEKNSVSLSELDEEKVFGLTVRDFKERERERESRDFQHQKNI